MIRLTKSYFGVENLSQYSKIVMNFCFLDMARAVFGMLQCSNFPKGLQLSTFLRFLALPKMIFQVPRFFMAKTSHSVYGSLSYEAKSHNFSSPVPSFPSLELQYPLPTANTWPFVLKLLSSGPRNHYLSTQMLRNVVSKIRGFLKNFVKRMFHVNK